MEGLSGVIILDEPLADLLEPLEALSDPSVNFGSFDKGESMQNVCSFVGNDGGVSIEEVVIF